MSSQDNLIYKLLHLTAWRMDAPRMYGAFHISAALIVGVCAVLCAAMVSRAAKISRAAHISRGAKVSRAAKVSRELNSHNKSSVNRPPVIRILAICGWVLVAMEVYKQLFLYYIVNDGAYDWWYFPFQLCSVPMYLCILLPVLWRKSAAESGSEDLFHCNIEELATRHASAFSAVLTFLATYTFVGAVAALAVPEDFMRSYVTLTLHGFIWHGILLFICLTVVFTGMADLSLRGFGRATLLFLGLCVIAVVINVLTEPAMASAHAAGLVPNRYAAMFYLNPFHLSPQPIVDTVQKSAGIPLGLALYVLTIILTSGAVDKVFSHLFRSRSR